VSDTVFKLNRAGSVALITIDNGEDYRKPTTLGRSAFESAVAVLDELERGDWSAAVFTGKPFVFCVGADIDEFTKLGSAEAALEGTRAGHALFARIRALPFPTVAAINGAALGGGLELALHCTARTLASNVRHIGFPEVALSIIPAWGGTQLLPKLIGPEAAARVIVLNPLRQNKLLTAPEAFELGIADRLVDPVEFVDESLQFARELGGLERSDPDWSELEAIVRKTRSRIDDAVHGATRAPYVALDLIAGAKDWSIEEGYAAEENAMAELLVSPQAQASAYAFTVVERRSKKPPNLPDVKPQLVAAQIHSATGAVLTVRLQNHDLLIDRQGVKSPLSTNLYQLGDVFGVKLMAHDGVVDCFFNGRFVRSYPIQETNCYFKAGCYTQSNTNKGDSPTAYGEVVIYGLSVTHKP
jgi:enoyl-CoA hydratase/carnithine racemase